MQDPNAWPFTDDAVRRINYYSNMLGNAAERRFAADYVQWRKCGCIGNEPRRGRVTIARAVTIADAIEMIAKLEVAS